MDGKQDWMAAQRGGCRTGSARDVGRLAACLLYVWVAWQADLRYLGSTLSAWEIDTLASGAEGVRDDLIAMHVCPIAKLDITDDGNVA